MLFIALFSMLHFFEGKKKNQKLRIIVAVAFHLLGNALASLIQRINENRKTMLVFMFHVFEVVCLYESVCVYVCVSLSVPQCIRTKNFFVMMSNEFFSFTCKLKESSFHRECSCLRLFFHFLFHFSTLHMRFISLQYKVFANHVNVDYYQGREIENCKDR